MSIRLQQVNPQGTKVYMGALTLGENIHKSLAKIAKEEVMTAATFELLGGLERVVFTEYDPINQVRKAPLNFERPLEIAAGHGTISWLDHEPHVHFHLVCSFQDENAPNGIALIAGHRRSAQMPRTEGERLTMRAREHELPSAMARRAQASEHMRVSPWPGSDHIFFERLLCPGSLDEVLGCLSLDVDPRAACRTAASDEYASHDGGENDEPLHSARLPRSHPASERDNKLRPAAK